MLSARFSLVALALSATLAPLERPRDPWVFRSVLDKHARIVTIALSKDLWVAYDATTCGLFRAWRGDVLFEGAVFNTMHGPQPTHRGTDVDDPLVGGLWRLARGGKFEDLAPVYRGHRFDGDPGKPGTRVTLDFELRTKAGETITVSESPEVDATSGTFERRFTVEGVPDGAHLVMRGAGTSDQRARVRESGDLRLSLGMGRFAPDPSAPGTIRMVRPHELEVGNGEHVLSLTVEHAP